MIIESETTKTIHMSELIQTFASLETRKNHFPSLKQKILNYVCFKFICCVHAVETWFCKHLLK